MQAEKNRMPLPTTTTFLLTFLFELSFSNDNDNNDVVYSNCIGLSDGTYLMKLIDLDEYPIINIKCNNEYMILDVNYDNELKKYFSTWFDWHYGLSGAARYDGVNWESWFLPSLLSNNKYDFKTSQNCNKCNFNNIITNELELNSVAYYSSRDLTMCMGSYAGYHGAFDHDWDTYQCYSCKSSELSKDASRYSL